MMGDHKIGLMSDILSNQDSLNEMIKIASRGQRMSDEEGCGAVFCSLFFGRDVPLMFDVDVRTENLPVDSFPSLIFDEI